MLKIKLKGFTCTRSLDVEIASFSQKAFTLAEVLITLGIIGVVAAMTLPTVINNTKNKELETAFKKTYSQLGQAIQSIFLQEYGGSGFNIGTTSDINSEFTNFVNYMQKQYKQSSICIDGSKSCPLSLFPLKNYSGTDGTNFIRNNYKSYNAKSANASGYCNDGIMSITDGSFIFFDKSSSDQDTAGKFFICIDVNGWKKRPNRFGHDFFMFEINQNTGKLLPMGVEGSMFPEDEYCSDTSTSVRNGLGCTAKALTEKDYFNNLPK